MKTKLVTQYRCDHCGKRGYSASHMTKHERRCTMNPNRECGMCAMFDDKPRPVTELVALLPDIENYTTTPFGEPDEWERFNADLPAAMTRLREATEGCPACILAALRQAGLHSGEVDYDFKAECKAWWDEFNHDHCEVY